MAIVTIDCPTPYDDQAVMRALITAFSTHAFDAGQQAIIARLIAGMAMLTNPAPTYQRPDAGAYVGGGLVASRS